MPRALTRYSRGVREPISTIVHRSTALLAAGALSLVGTATAGAQAGLSPNWSGYVAQRTGVQFDQVQASWRVPTASCAHNGLTSSLAWVGLGDATGLSQIGSGTDCTAGGSLGPPIAYAIAFWEILPLDEQYIPLDLEPGDLVHASVTVAAHEVTMTLNDLTRGWRFVRTARRSRIDKTSAEWIVEDPETCPGPVLVSELCPEQPFAEFSTITIFDARARATTGRSGAISSRAWSAIEREVIAGKRGQAPFVAAAPFRLKADGTAFSVSRTHRPLPPEPV